MVCALVDCGGGDVGVGLMRGAVRGRGGEGGRVLLFGGVEVE